ncbi:MAG: hypothetical protein JSU08_08350 [Acidobacteria bacterium]|nr:hypothetical protein [Acidobacteriota bacterium]
MRSSTSVSDTSSARPLTIGERHARLRRATWALAIGCALVAGGLEVVARTGLDRASKIQRRMVAEYRSAVRIGQDGVHGRHLLVIGNSLLDEGVDFERLRGSLGDRFDARRYMVEQTVYYDWLYGLRRLFNEGARPDIVLVMLGTGHWLSPNIRGDYSAQYMMSRSDLPRVALDLGMHPTQASGLLFAGVSKFWGARTEMRTFVLRHIMPDLADFMNMSSAVDHRPMVTQDIEPVLASRIARLRAVTEAHGTQLVLLVPPLLNPDDGSDALMAAADANHVAVLRPVTSGTFGANLYRDGFHLNETGAAQFTERLIPVLLEEFATDPRLNAHRN